MQLATWQTGFCCYHAADFAGTGDPLGKHNLSHPRGKSEDGAHPCSSLTSSNPMARNPWDKVTVYALRRQRPSLHLDHSFPNKIFLAKRNTASSFCHFSKNFGNRLPQIKVEQLPSGVELLSCCLAMGASPHQQLGDQHDQDIQQLIMGLQEGDKAA